MLRSWLSEIMILHISRPQYLKIHSENNLTRVILRDAFGGTLLIRTLLKFLLWDVCNDYNVITLLIIRIYTALNKKTFTNGDRSLYCVKIPYFVHQMRNS